jgi:hypothetical protein
VPTYIDPLMPLVAAPEDMITDPPVSRSLLPPITVMPPPWDTDAPTMNSILALEAVAAPVFSWILPEWED